MIKKITVILLLINFLSCNNSNKPDSQSLEQLDKKGNYYLKNNQLDSAIIVYQKVIKTYPEKPNGYYGKGVAKAMLCYQNQSNCKEAINLMNKTVSINPKYKKAYFNMGIYYTSLGNFKESISCFDKAIALDSANGEYYCNRGYSKLMLNDNLGACNDFDRAKSFGAKKANIYLKNCK